MPVSRLHFAPSAARAERQVPARAAAAAAAAASSPAAEDDDEVEDDDEFEEDEYEEDDSPPPPVDEAALQLAVDLARTASDTKAADVMVLDVAPLVSWTSYLVIASVNSRPQLMAVLARCEQKALEVGVERRNNPTGRSQWECVDLGSVVVHAMTPAQREAYALEDFYGAADEVQWWEDGEEGMEEEEKGGVGAWTTRTKGQ
jgi:ribosome-associated protein